MTPLNRDMSIYFLLISRSNNDLVIVLTRMVHVREEWGGDEVGRMKITFSSSFIRFIAHFIQAEKEIDGKWQRDGEIGSQQPAKEQIFFFFVFISSSLPH